MSVPVAYDFPTDLESIEARIDAIDPIKYGKTRNYIDGDVTYLSPYISRGVISTKYVKDKILAKGYKTYQIEKFLQELAWRDYWQALWQHHGNGILHDLKQPQPDVQNNQISAALIHHKTGIEAIDYYIEQLYAQGYMHNHVRMYVASIACNIAKSHWLVPANWLYYYLLDGDVASNHLSWQWTCGAASSKKYYCNQENISKFTNSRQVRSFMAHDYDTIATMPIPDILKATTLPEFITELPENTNLKIDTSLPTCVYNSYNLDPFWHEHEKMNRVLLLEPDHFKKHPVNKKVIDFVIGLSKNIDGIQVYVGSFNDIVQQYEGALHQIFYKEHPAFKHYKGICEIRDWLNPAAKGNFNSFFQYWKIVSKQIK
ncbi:FAD-binding domain-containing protein [Ferruginibacter yonginensis]|uniref:FAD-binding domain-containing protein n=1 Tax=Ferruginibacter yonginensis TaxID=1310416 RepID=A0ABV8QNK4_9BACT